MHNRVSSLKHRLDKAGSNYAKYAQVVTHGPNLYQAQHVTKQQKFLPKTCDLLAGGCRMLRYNEIQAAKGEQALKEIRATEALERALAVARGGRAGNV